MNIPLLPYWGSTRNKVVGYLKVWAKIYLSAWLNTTRGKWENIPMKNERDAGVSFPSAQPYLTFGSLFKRCRHNETCIIYDKDKRLDLYHWWISTKRFQGVCEPCCLKSALWVWWKKKKFRPLNISFRVTNELFDLEQTDAWLAYSDNNTLWSSISEMCLVNAAPFSSHTHTHAHTHVHTHSVMQVL